MGALGQSPQWGSRGKAPGQGVRGTKSPEADNIFLLQRLISYQIITKFGNLVYMASVGARLHQHIMVRGSEGRSW